jgi:Rrf2 family protein
MLRISKKADYAVFLLGAIARQGAYPGGPAPESVLSAHEIARQAGLNKSVVANLLKEFARAGMLESVRGLKGGYKLLRSPYEISLGNILEVVEGPFTLVDCVEGRMTGGHATERSAGAPAGTGLLSLAKGQAEPEHTCSLIGFCPSRQPMRIVHERIAQLFRQIHLAELCNLTALATTPLPQSRTLTAPR